MVEDPRRILAQLLGTPSVNLVTGPRESRSLAPGDPVVLPRAFFVDIEGLGRILRLPTPQTLSVPFEIYRQNLTSFRVREDDGAGFGPDTVEGVGLTSSIRGRVGDVGGRVEIDGNPERGTEVRLWV